MGDVDMDWVEYETPDLGGAACPDCGARCVRVAQTLIRTQTGVFRRHLCGCGRAFKSVEKVVEKGKELCTTETQRTQRKG